MNDFRIQQRIQHWSAAMQGFSEHKEALAQKYGSAAVKWAERLNDWTKRSDDLERRTQLTMASFAVREGRARAAHQDGAQSEYVAQYDKLLEDAESMRLELEPLLVVATAGHWKRNP
ncbi:MAG: hypothetical protein NTZ05_09440 [Chloroflexi bacterium]|nr:hypothetical protein [Chloroflexota bacterium]